MNTGIGIEVEVENAQAFNPAFWTVKRDESLRNNGIEFVTNFGLVLQEVPRALDSLFKPMIAHRKMNPGASMFDFNERTSIHIHVDVRKLSTKELKNLILLYILYEESLFKIAGVARKDNVFCVPIRYIAMSHVSQGNMMALLNRWQKYCAINLSSVPKFGTVEFRHMEGNDDVPRIMSWVFVLAKLVDYCRTVSDEYVMDKIVRLKYFSEYINLTNEVFGGLSDLIDISPENLDIAASDAKFFFNTRA